MKFSIVYFIMVPAFLSKGDTVAVVATAKVFDHQEVRNGIEVLRSWGLISAITAAQARSVAVKGVVSCTASCNAVHCVPLRKLRSSAWVWRKHLYLA